MKTIEIAGEKIGAGNPVFIIAEAGVNHNGRLTLAKKLVAAAKRAGADAVKFQTFIAEDVVTGNAPQAAYQKKNAAAKSQLAMLKKLELTEKEFRRLKKYCQRKKIIFLSTPFSGRSARFLFSLGVPAFKISSGELTNLPLLKVIASFGKPVILSTGMATLAETRDAVKVLSAAGNRDLVLLHCTSNYPARPQDANLRALATLAGEFKVPIGFSDHTEGHEITTAAVALGAVVIEKHLTLDRRMSGPDHQASLDPAQFAVLVAAVRKVEAALGTGKKKPAALEKEVMAVARRSLVAARDIAAGSRLTPEMIAVKRPGYGLAPKYLRQVIGRRTKRNLKTGTLFSWGILK